MVKCDNRTITFNQSTESIIECLTQNANSAHIKSTYLCTPEDPTDDTCSPEYSACGPDYGVNCMPDCDPADDY